MSAIDSTVFDDIESAVSDLRGSTLQTFPHALKRLSDALRSPALANINNSLTAGVDFEAFYNQSLASAGGGLVHGQLLWPAEREKELGLTLILIERLARDPNWTIQVCRIFFALGSSKKIDAVHTLASQVLRPFARNYRRYVERQLRDQDASGEALGMAGTRRRIFVSHIHEEAALAKVICDWATDAFKGSGVTAFVSSDRQSLPAGRKWLDVVKANLEGSEVAIAVLSPEALTRPWPNIELGAAWIREIAVIPFCHSGLSANDLPRPFSDFQGVNIDNRDPGRDLLGGVADALKLQHPENLDFVRFSREAMAAMLSIKYAAVEPSSKPEAGLPDVQVRILQFLAAQLNDGVGEELPMEVVAGGANIRPASLKGHAQALHDQRLAHIDYYSTGDVTLRLTAGGAEWLERHHLMPD